VVELVDTSDLKS